MIAQIVSDYGSLPDFRTLSFTEICFFYENLIPSLIELTRPQKK